MNVAVLSRLVAPMPCEMCSGVAFCGRPCREAAGYHRYECRHMGLLLGSGMSVLCHLALRAVTQRGLAFFRALQAGQLGEEQSKYTKVRDYPVQIICSLKKRSQNFF
jgi:hypothetical protein